MSPVQRELRHTPASERHKIPTFLNFYAEGELGGLIFDGTGKCTTLRRDFPEPGLNVAARFLHLGGLEDRYAGGLLTSNTVVSPKLCADSAVVWCRQDFGRHSCRHL
jgi:hypothetical protein